ncbi:MAG: adenylate/guanylate cyclase domain-containing protein [Saprospiraceae bacterium]|nr:adenylate/guanylate cyclase domain-containing protein [Saprospiraceae bacterium]
MSADHDKGELLKSYPAYDLRLVTAENGPVVKKVFDEKLSSASVKKLIQKEADFLQKLDHPGVPAFVGVDTESEKPSIDVSAFPGKSLDERFDGALNLREFFDFAFRLLDIVRYAHENLIYHFAVSPENIFISEDWKKVWLVNYTYAQDRPVSGQKFIKKFGKQLNPLYISPEQTGRTLIRSDSRSDIYSLGLVFYFVLTDQSAYPEGQLSKVIHNHLAKTPDSPNRINDAIPDVLSDIIMKMIAKDVKSRYQSITGLLADIERVQKAWKEGMEMDSFELGDQDVIYEFKMPYELHGRKTEIESLHPSSPHEIHEGKLTFIEGAEGVGKSHFIRTYSRRYCEFDHEYFEIRCDDTDSTSFSPFLKIINNIYKHAAKKSKKERMRIGNALKETLGKGDDWVIDLIPAVTPFLEDFFDRKITQREENRTEVQLLINWLFSAVALPDKPLILFLDEFQSSDPESRQFVQEMALIERVPNSYFVFSVNKEEFPGYPDYIDGLTSRGVQGVSEVILDPLDTTSFEKIIFDIIHRSDDDVNELSNYLFKVTNGNLRYLKDFFLTAIDKNTFIFNPERNHWVFDLERVKSIEIPEDSLDFVMDKVDRLEEDTSELLSFIAIYGEQFNQGTLEKYFKEFEGHANHLKQIEDAGLIQPVGVKSIQAEVTNGNRSRSDMYDFVHVKLQQRLYQTIPQSKKSELHRQIGLSMLRSVGPGPLGTAAIEIANHFLHVEPEAWRSNEKKEVQKVMLQAASQAKISTSFDLALEYLQLGLNVGIDHMSREVQFRYLEMAGECAYLSGHYQLAEKYLDQALVLGNSSIEKARVYQSQLIMCNLKGELDRVMRLGIKALNLLGVNVKYKSTSLTIIGQLIRITWRHRGMERKDFLELPKMTDPKALLAHEILLQVLSWSFSQSPELLGVMVLKIHELTLRYGNSKISYAGYGGYGAVLSEGFGKDVKGVDYIMLGQEVSHQFNDSQYKFRGIASGGGTVVHRALPWKNTIQDLMTGLEKARELGDITNYGSLSFLLSDQLIFHGQKLDEIFDQAKDFLNYAKVKNYEDMEIYHQARFSHLDYLLSDEDDDVLEFKNELSSKIERTLYGYVKSSISIFKLLIAILEDRKDDLEHLLQECEELKGSQTVNILEVLYAVLRTLGSVMAMDASSASSGPYRKWIRQDLKFISRFCKNVPEDYTSFKVILQAAMLISRDKAEGALETLNNEYPEEEKNLFANVMKSKLQILILNKTGRDTGEAVRELKKVNAEWGCKRLDKILGDTYGAPYESDPAQKEGITDFNEYLDIETVLKANAALSEDINLESLVKNLLGILVEHAGASHGKLLLHEEGRMVLASVYGDESEHLNFEIIYPEGIIGQTTETLEPVIIHNLHEHDDLHNEGYFDQVFPLSILSVPILNRGKLVGIVYLENHFTPNVFTHERLNLIRAISAQAAMSLENSRQYSRILKLNYAYEKFVPREFLRYLDKKSILDIQLGDQIRRNMTIMFSDMRDFTNLSEKLTPKENFDFINDYLLEMEPLIREHGGFIDKYIGDSIMALFPSSPVDAVKCAVEMNETLKLNNQKKNRKLEVGYGINTGELMLGIIGGRDRMEGTVISDTVNIAARIESLTKHYGTPILISDATYGELESGHGLDIRKIDNVIAKGKTHPVGIFEVLVGLDDKDRNGWLSTYNEAMKDFGDGHWKKAQQKLKAVLEVRSDDSVAKTYLTACEEFIEQGVTAKQPHISVFDKK